MKSEITDIRQLNEIYKDNNFKLGTAGYINEDGSFTYLDEYHGEDKDIQKLGLPEFSNTHPEDDTCVRIYKEPNKIQYEKLEEIIDAYLDNESYCKIEMWDNNLKYYFYEIYSLIDNACSDYSFKEKIGNWTGYDLVKIIKANIKKNNYNESLLIEATRNQLLAKSRNAKTLRWQKKDKCQVANTVKDYNKIDMDTFWKKDILNFKIKIKGETNYYLVAIEFANILSRMQKAIKENKNKLEIKCVYNSLFQALNSSDVKVDCSCPDYKYRFKVWATKQGYNTGEKETRDAKITNPNDNKGAACKHILNVLNNSEWLQKIASVINNYINYCKDHMQYNYARFIFPKLYGMTYEKAVQLTLNDYDDKGNIKDKLQSDEELINLSNALGKVRGRFKPGSNKNPAKAKDESLNESIQLNENFENNDVLYNHYQDHCITDKNPRDYLKQWQRDTFYFSKKECPDKYAYKKSAIHLATSPLTSSRISGLAVIIYNPKNTADYDLLNPNSYRVKYYKFKTLDDHFNSYKAAVVSYYKDKKYRRRFIKTYFKTNTKGQIWIDPQHTDRRVEKILASYDLPKSEKSSIWDDDIFDIETCVTEELALIQDYINTIKNKNN